MSVGFATWIMKKWYVALSCGVQLWSCTDFCRTPNQVSLILGYIDITQAYFQGVRLVTKYLLYMHIHLQAVLVFGDLYTWGGFLDVSTLT